MALPQNPPPTSPPPQLLITPLMVSMIGIIAAALAITAYHFIVSKYCLRDQPLPTEPTTGLKSLNGVDQKILESIPIRTYKIEPIGSFRVNETECVVCLGELEEGDPIRLLPGCNHAFHLECIDQWFNSHSNCPLCRSPIVGATTVDEASFSGPQLLSQSDSHSTEYVAGSSPNPGSFEVRVGSKALLRPCASPVMPTEKKPQVMIVGLKRSFSMDSCNVSVKISQYLQQNSSSSSSSSSSSNVACLWTNSFKGGSFKRLDHASSALMRSFSLLRIGHNSGSESGRLPV